MVTLSPGALAERKAKREEEYRMVVNQYGTLRAAVESDPMNFRFVSYSCAFADDLKSDRNIVLAAVECGNAATKTSFLEYASPSLRNDEEIVLKAVQKHGCALQYASPDLQNNRAIVLAAVQQDGRALRCASSDLQNDETIVLAAASAPNGTWDVLASVQDKFKNNEKIVLAAVQTGRDNLKYASDELKSNEAIVMAALANPKSDPRTILHVGPELKKKIMDAKRKFSMTCQEYAAARRKPTIIQVSAVRQTEAALTVTCATVAGDEYVVELDPRTENSTAVLRDKVAPQIDVPPANLDIVLDSRQLCTPHSDSQICVIHDAVAGGVESHTMT